MVQSSFNFTQKLSSYFCMYVRDNTLININIGANVNANDANIDATN